MRAVVVRASSEPTGAELIEVPRPAPGPGQVLIKVGAASVNPIDVFTASGAPAVQAGISAGYPQTGIGWDVAGTVEELGAGVTEFATGDAVIGLSDLVDVPLATFADYVVLDTAAVAAAPEGVTPEQAATIPLNGLTVVQALDVLDLRAGQTLLVTGAAGGVGGYAVQLAAERGLRVVAVAGADDEQLVRELGAQLFVPRTDDLGSAVRAVVPGGVDGALDAALTGLGALNAVRGGGAFVSVVGGATPPPLRGIRVHTLFVRADARQLAELSTAVEQDRLTLRVADTYPLTEVAVAHERLAKGGIRGRLVLLP